ncbi:nucleic-acid-binding protein from transposon X-element [Trichonephila inaurata madagascariensis]|uniref:Nucleic-acid-binding protein from transposon X-element n=1 Tax=Trichonephila inaurata madagascariensis TaxID=2747483 RepID=A0A8X7C7B2_9ARAC|nr:nucleic-acid-binding protein from transposon X-element [Trichonephila inaurata madagascariensis]
MARTKQTARKTAQNLPPPTDHDICNELMMIQMRLELLRSQMIANEKFLIRCRLGTIKILPYFEEQLKSEIAAKNKLTPPKEMIDKTETAKDATEDKSVLRKNTRTKDFISPTKFAKKQKVAENDPIGASAPIKIANQYQALAGNSTIPDPDIAVVPVATRKLPPINLKFQTNYKPIVKEISQKFPTSSTKLSGEFLKIFATSPDEHRNITNFLTEKGEQFFAIEPVAKRPQKVVIKGLPITTDVDDIKTDLTERGFDIIKVAQLTKAKTKFKLPFF